MSRPQQVAAPPGSIDELNKIVIDYLNKKGYTRTEAVLRLEANRNAGGALGEAKGSAAWLDGTPEAYEHAYKSLSDWVDASLNIYRDEMRKLLFPIFVHCFLDLVGKEHVDAAKRFFQSGLGDHEVLHGYDIRQLSAVTLPTHLEENDMAKLYRTNKYRLALSRSTFDLMLNFLFEHEAEGGSIIMRLVNQYVEIIAMSGRPSRETSALEGIQGHAEVQTDEVNSEPVKLGAMNLDKDMQMDVEIELADEDVKLGLTTDTLFDSFTKSRADSGEGPGRETLPMPPYKTLDVMKEVEGIKDARKRISLGVAAGASLPSVCMYTFHNTHDNLCCIDIASDESMMVGGFGESYIRAWALKDKSHGRDLPFERSTKRLIGHSGPVYGATFSPDNRYVLSGSEDKTARLWSLDTQSCLVAYRGHNAPIWDVSFSPFGHYFATASHDMTARLWSCDHIYPLRVFAGHLSDVDVVQFHPNSTYVLTGSSDKTCRLWDLSRGQSVRVFTGCSAPVTSCAVSPNGRLVAAGADNGTIELWDIASGRRMKTMKGHAKSPVYSLTFSQENSVLVSGGADATVRVWDVKKLNNQPLVLSGGAHADAGGASIGAGLATNGDSKPAGPTGGTTNGPTGTLNVNAAPAAASAERKKELEQTSDHMLCLRTKQTPVYRVHFTKRNLCLAVSASTTAAPPVGV
ncbi:Transcription initiation factor TFIID subunit 5 [Savitreella phatthalungensis]